MPTDPHTSVVLLARAQAGDQEARDALYRRILPSIKELVRRRMGAHLRQRADSLDIVQSALVEAVAGVGRFQPDGDGALLRWMARIAENKLRRQARDMRVGDRNPARNRRLDPLDSEEVGHEPAERSVLVPARKAASDEERDWVQGLLEQLPERERVLIRLRKLEERNWEEVLELSGEENLKAARSAFSRGLARLATLAAARRLRRD